MELITEAIEFAAKVHDGMRRKKSNTPYILHPLEAAVIVGMMTDDQEVIAAAVLHDVVEDTSVTIEEIEEKFGKRIRDLVESETENKRPDIPPSETWRIRKEESLKVLQEANDIGVLMIWLGDKLANMRSIYHEFQIKGMSMWEKFNQKDVNEHAWYYYSIAKLTERLSHTSAWKEYRSLLELVFGKREFI